VKAGVPAVPLDPYTQGKDQDQGEMSQSRLPRTLNQREAKQLLKANGWTEERGGKHDVKMTKPGHRPITLPMHGGHDYSRDLTAAILRQAGLRKGGER
jgi:predicted RNA binding protein YcfA (HicA-like mRNA interferase family)